MDAVEARARVTPEFRDARARGFYDRMDAGMGRYLTREQIVARNAARTSDLLRGIPGVDFAGGSRSTIPWLGGNRRRHGSGTLGACMPFLYIDGYLRVLRGNERLDDIVDPSEVWGIEVYRYASDIPSELPRRGMAGNCGAIVIWTVNS
jgi:hypothetical protein